MEQHKEIKQNWTRPENCFCAVFDRRYQSFSFGRLGTRLWLNFIQFLGVLTISYIPKILSLLANHEATRRQCFLYQISSSTLVVVANLVYTKSLQCSKYPSKLQSSKYSLRDINNENFNEFFSIFSWCLREFTIQNCSETYLKLNCISAMEIFCKNMEWLETAKSKRRCSTGF